MNKLLKNLRIVAAVALFITACGAQAIQAQPEEKTAPTLASPTSIPTTVVQPSPTLPEKQAIEKVWDADGAPNTFNRPTELALDPQDNIYIIDGGNQRVQKFDKDGNFLLMWGSQGNKDGQFLFHVPPAHYGSIAV